MDNNINKINFLCDKQKKFKRIMLCNHFLVKDMIDVDVEKSITIIYCKRCWFNFG
jgi:hypothetical protein